MGKTTDKILTVLKIKKKKKENEDANTTISGEGVHVTVRRKYNGDTMQAIYKTIAIERRTDNSNIELINNEYSFQEELIPSTEKKISNLEKALITKQLEANIKNDKKIRDLDTKAEKLKTINTMIEEQEDLIKNIKNNHVTKEIESESGEIIKERLRVNVIDEENNLRYMKLLKEHIENYSSTGGYEWLNELGQRERFFNWVDGFLYPVKENIPNHLMYTDMITKRKQYKSERDILDKDYLEDTKRPFSDLMRNIVFVVLLLLIGLFGFATFKALEYKSELDIAQTNSVACTYVFPNWVNNESVALEFIETTNDNLYPEKDTILDEVKAMTVDLTNR